jgi:cyclopropane fatty-acyl-phospholipid synthase-like methyltransferase
MDTGSAEYVLGGSDAERARLRAQAEDHEASARWLLREAGVAPGWRVLDVGCGPAGILALLSELVGHDGEVIGLEREDRFVEMARAEVAQRGLGNVTVVKGMPVGGPGTRLVRSCPRAAGAGQCSRTP